MSKDEEAAYLLCDSKALFSEIVRLTEKRSRVIEIFKHKLANEELWNAPTM